MTRADEYAALLENALDAGQWMFSEEMTGAMRLARQVLLAFPELPADGVLRVLEAAQEEQYDWQKLLDKYVPPVWDLSKARSEMEAAGTKAEVDALKDRLKQMALSDLKTILEDLGYPRKKDPPLKKPTTASMAARVCKYLNKDVSARTAGSAGSRVKKKAPAKPRDSAKEKVSAKDHEVADRLRTEYDAMLSNTANLAEADADAWFEALSRESPSVIQCLWQQMGKTTTLAPQQVVSRLRDDLEEIAINVMRARRNR